MPERVKSLADSSDRPRSAAEASSQDRPAQARERLLWEAKRIFAEKGYAQASTREICQAAGANVASIHYYFGDKAGLYRAVLLELAARAAQAWPRGESDDVPLDTSMRCLMAPFLLPQSQAADDLPWLMRIHLREMVEPTPMLRDLLRSHLAPHYQALLALLARHCGLAEPDDDLRRLALALLAMLHDCCMSHEWADLLAPGLLNGPQAGERALDSLVGYACALVRHEARRRGGASSFDPGSTKAP